MKLSFSVTLAIIPLCISLLVSRTSVFAQCAVSKFKGKHSTTYVSKSESIYKNEDLENGLLTYKIRIIMNKDTSVTIPNSFIFECQYYTSFDYIDNGVVPRRIAFFFEGNRTLYALAVKEERLSDLPKGVQGQNYSYAISDELFDLLKRFSLTRILILDTRTEKVIECQPYKDLLKDQIFCLGATSRAEN